MYREYRVNADIDFTYDFDSYDIRQLPTSATISIYNSAGTAVVSAQTAAIDSSGLISYTLPAASNATEGRNFKLALTYVQSGKTIIKNYLFDVVKTPLENDVDDEQLFSYLPEIRSKIKDLEAETTADGTVSTFYCDQLKNDGRSFLGGRVSIYIETTANCTVRHEAKITAFDQTLGKCTFSPAYSAAIASGTILTLRPSYQQLINTAFNGHVIRDVRNKVNPYSTNTDGGGTASQYIDNTVVHNLVIFKTLEIYSFAQMEESGDKWEKRGEYFKQMYNDELTALANAYDKNQDGNIDSTENRNRLSAVNIEIER